MRSTSPTVSGHTHDRPTFLDPVAGVPFPPAEENTPFLPFACQRCQDRFRRDGYFSAALNFPNPSQVHMTGLVRWEGRFRLNCECEWPPPPAARPGPG